MVTCTQQLQGYNMGGFGAFGGFDLATPCESYFLPLPSMGLGKPSKAVKPSVVGLEGRALCQNAATRNLKNWSTDRFRSIGRTSQLGQNQTLGPLLTSRKARHWGPDSGPKLRANATCAGIPAANMRIKSPLPCFSARGAR